MRVLVITHSYSPVNDPRAFRWGAICEYWAQSGIIVDVVCSAANATLPQFEQLNRVNVYRVSDPSQRFRSNEGGSNDEKKSNPLSWRIKTKQLIHSLVKKTIVMVRWPDHAWLWIPKAYKRTAHLLETHHYDGIFSVAVPFSSHIVAMLLGRKRKGIEWVCDYGDPFSFLKELPMNNTRLYKRINKFIENKLINASQKISVTTPETLNEYVSYLGVPKKWLHVIPPVVGNNYIDESIYTNSNSLGKESINLIFAGTLYTKIRNPKYLLELVSKLRAKLVPRQLKLHFYGRIGDCQSEFDPYIDAINDWIFLHGIVNKDDMLNVYKNADILVNIGNTTAYQVPSKVIEYMSTGLPILNIASVDRDSSVSMLEDYPCAFSLFQNAGISDTTLDEICTFINNSSQVAKSTVNKIMAQYQLPEVANAYIDLFSRGS
ncbi:glycosyltransferase [Legionella maioricensis]|uniref:Glycosyltransferase n=1 Tax=Legionella maioricensis TaxID=2896528 RepID=A0A9X2CZW0_9GAMM|nr:glycosyltransferase [Legionella maioricensis]MCL9683550.1 glycosyltransferase [Legionella maioricensis]MCL9686849.1 glycosyltransferase [Legionella maioricensis]